MGPGSAPQATAESGPTHLPQVEETDEGQVEDPEEVADHPLPEEG